MKFNNNNCSNKVFNDNAKEASLLSARIMESDLVKY